MLRSVDGGSTFAASQLPVASGAQTLVSFAGHASQLDMVAFGRGQQDVVFWQPGFAANHLPSAGLPSSMPLADLVALPDGSLLAANPSNNTGQFGIECLSQGGTGWRYSC
jgi:hypothetical protein